MNMRAEINKLATEARTVRIGHYIAPAVNVSPGLSQDVAEELLLQYPEAPFVVTYWDNRKGNRFWNCFSNQRIDLGYVARTYYGRETIDLHMLMHTDKPYDEMCFVTKPHYTHPDFLSDTYEDFLRTIQDAKSQA
jgi:hypothetical protein